MKPLFDIMKAARANCMDFFGEELGFEDEIEEAYNKAVSIKDFAAEIEHIEEEGVISLDARDAVLAAIEEDE